eukprot:2988080-Amphidinium_carterae.1
MRPPIGELKKDRPPMDLSGLHTMHPGRVAHKSVREREKHCRPACRPNHGWLDGPISGTPNMLRFRFHIL